jgi:hypothetical protein
VTWSNIKMTNITFPIFITQTYQDQSVTKNPNSGSTKAVKMRDFTFSAFSGTINSKNPGDGSCVTMPRSSCWYYDSLPNMKHNEAVIMQCASEESCSNFVVKGMKLKTDTAGPTSVICSNVGKVANPKLGFTCANGPFSQ